MEKTTVVCSISGVTLNADDEAVLEEFTPKDEAPELPVGWTRITVETRSINPAYEAIALVKASMVQQILAQFPVEQRDDLEDSIAIQIDAQFAALESLPRNVPTQLTRAVVFVAPVDRVPGLDKELQNGLAVFGLDIGKDDAEDEEMAAAEDLRESRARASAPAPAPPVPAPAAKPATAKPAGKKNK